MFRTPTLKTLYDKRWVILAWSLGAFAMNMLITWIFPDFKNPQLIEVFKSLPESLQAFSGSLDIGTIQKYLDSQVFFNNGSFIFWILGISIGVNLMASDEDKGTLETALATKASRSRLYVEKFLAMLFIFLIVSVASTLGIWLALFIIHEPVNAIRLIQATFMLFVFTCLLGSFSFGIGALSGRKNLAIGVPTLALVVMFLVYTFSQTIKWMKNWDKFTWNYYYAHNQTVMNGISYRDLSVLIISTAIFFVAGIIFFNKRDLRK